MTKSAHLQFLALMLPTVLVLVLAAVSLANPDPGILLEPSIQLPVQAAVDDPGHETAY